MNEGMNVLSRKVTIMDNIVLNVKANTHFLTVELDDESEKYISDTHYTDSDRYLCDVVKKMLEEVKAHFAILTNFDFIDAYDTKTIIFSFNIKFVNKVKKQHETKTLVSLNEVFLKEIEDTIDKVVDVLDINSRHLRILDAIGKTI